MSWNEEIKQVIPLHQKAYKLLLWVQGAMDSGWISANSAHQNITAAHITKNWLLKHYLNLPNDCRPNKDDQVELDEFCNLFSAFLLTSFDIAKNPGKRLYSEGAHCFCPMCSYMVNVSHLKPKKLTKKDKMRAKKVKLDALIQLCLDDDITYQEELLVSLSEGNDTCESVSIIAYSYELVRRSKGIIEGPAVLVLWRDFAWNIAGSPKKNFKFTLKLALKAKDLITLKLRESQSL